jgi:hypothetical protein
MTKTMCHRCGFEAHEHEPRGADGQAAWQCPDCGGGLFRQVASPPRPATYATALLRAVVSLPGLLFAGFYGVLIIAPIPFSGVVAASVLYLVAVRLACKAMLATGGRVEFPEIDADDLLDFRWLVPAAVYGLFFRFAPVALSIAAVTMLDGAARVAAVVAAAGLLLYAPMALVQLLRTASTWGLLAVPDGVRHVLRDPRGYGVLLALFSSASVVTLLVSLSPVGYLGSAVGELVYAASTMFAFGLVGLYVRQHARALGVECDGADWAPARQVTFDPLTAGEAWRGAPVVPARPRAPIALEVEPWVSSPEIVVGDLIESAPQRPAPIDFVEPPTTNP